MAEQQLTERDPLLMVTAPVVLAAVEQMGETATLANGIRVTKAQLAKAGAILRDGPQPLCNGLRDDMPGFIDRADQTGRSLVLRVGILPTRVYRIDRLGRSRPPAPP